MNQPLHPPIQPAPDPGGPRPPAPDADLPPARRSWSGRLSKVAVAALATTLLILTGCDADPVEEVDVADVAEDGQATGLPEGGTVSLTGDVHEILTESALTVTGERSEDPLLVLLTPATIVNGAAVTLGGQPQGLAQVVPSEGMLQVIGTIDTFDSVALAERLGIVLNEELFSPWDGDRVLIAEQVDTFDVDGGPAAETGLESE